MDVAEKCKGKWFDSTLTLAAGSPANLFRFRLTCLLLGNTLRNARVP